jgi:hypothetical protein
VRSLKSTAAVIAVGATLVLSCGLSTAAASAHSSTTTVSTRTSRTPEAANVCSSTAASGKAVAGALPAAEVQRRLSSLTEQHREAQGHSGSAIAGKGPLGATAAASGQDSARQPLLDIHPAAGTSFKQLAGMDGSCATQSVTTALSVDSSSTIYTPTMYPAGGSCIELTTVYTRSQASVSAWDWCRSINFAASVPINSSFLTTYTDGSSHAYTGRVIKTNASSNTWQASLYNYTTDSWDTLFTQSGQNQSGRTDGWDIEELYSTVGSSGQAASCDVMAGQNFESSNITVRINGAWTAASTANSDTHYDQPNSAFFCPTRSFQMVSAYTHWKDVG